MRCSCFVVTIALSLLLANSLPVLAEDTSPIDWPKAQEIHRRSVRGEKLTPEEQAYLDRAKKEHDKGRGQQATGGQGAAGRLHGQSLDLVPLTDLGADQKYKGMDGGLYGGGRNTPPEALLAAAMEQSARIAPLDADGKPAADGKIVLMSLGMSNTTGEFSRFKPLADKDPAKNPKVLIVDCAQGGMDAAAWVSGKGTRDPWEAAADRLRRAGVSGQQVQVVWIKQALANPAALGEFPKHVQVLQDDLATILNMLHQRFPHLRLAYLSSRIYAGNASSQLNPEPFAYEGAFAVRGVIQEQQQGEAKLNWDPAKGEVRAPLALWGPYLWANGTKGRKVDGLVYSPEDFAGDGTHPGDSGARKVADLLLTFLKSDPTAKLWFTAR